MSGHVIPRFNNTMCKKVCPSTLGKGTNRR